MEGVFNINASEEDNERNLQEYLSGKQALLVENEKALQENRKDLSRKYVAFVTVIAEKEKVIAEKEKVIAEIDTEINHLKENYLQQDEQKIETTATNYDTVSGLEYVRKSHRVGFGLPNTTNNIGLIVGIPENGGTRWTVREDVDTTPASTKLQDAWNLVSSRDSSLNDDEFLQKLRSQVPKLDNHFLNNAWKACQFEFIFDVDTERGEMEYHQFVYLHFSMLFQSAAQGSGMKYKAGLRVDSTLSLRCKSTEEDDFGSLANKIWVFPDAAVTLYKGWDIFGMMEVKLSI